MSTAVYLRLRDGRRVRFAHARDPGGAETIRRHAEQWVAEGATVSVADHTGRIEDVGAQSVVAIELADDPTPPTGMRTVQN
jgi:hypothetical protein